MKVDLMTWRCICGNDHNPVTNLKCLKCQKRRWSQLGITDEDAYSLLCSTLPASWWDKVATQKGNK